MERTKIPKTHHCIPQFTRFIVLTLLLLLVGAASAYASNGYSLQLTDTQYYNDPSAGFVTVLTYTLTWNADPTTGNKFGLSHVDLGMNDCVTAANIVPKFTTPGFAIGDPSNGMDPCLPNRNNVIKWEEGSLPPLPAGGATTFTIGLKGLWAIGSNNLSWAIKAGQTCEAGSTSGPNCVPRSASNFAPACAIDHAVQSICAGSGTPATFVGQANGGSGGYTYSWTGPSGFAASTQSIVVSAPGDYVLTVTDSHGFSCSGTTAHLNVNQPPTVTVSGPDRFCSTSGAQTLTASGADSYSWSTGASGPTISVTGSGTYTVTGTDANGCSSTASKTVIVDQPTNAHITPGGPTTFCDGGSVALTASGGTSFLWSTGETTASITVSAAGTYTVTASNGDGNTCGKTSDSVDVHVDTPPIAGIQVGGPLTFCEGGSVTLTATGGSSFLWSTGAATPSITVSSTGDYSVEVSNGNTCGPRRSEVVHVTVNPLPTPSISGDEHFCKTSGETLTASGGTSYKWSTGAETASITVTDSGTYSVTVTDANGCSASTSKTVVADEPPTAEIAGGPLTFCAGGSVTLTASGGSSFHWSTGADTANITVDQTGDYTVTVSNKNTCADATKTVHVTVNPLPTPSIAGPEHFCKTAGATLTASGGTSYKWSPGGETTASISVSESGTYSVTVTDDNGCSASTSKAVVADQPPTADISGSPLTFCAGGSVTLTASGGASFHWSTGADTASISVDQTGDYTVTVSNNNTCDPATKTVHVTVNPLPTPSISGPDHFCKTSGATLTASGGVSYLWSPGGATTADLHVSESGTYTVTVTDANGCSASTSKNVVADEPPSPAINASGPLTFCQGGSVTLTATGGTSFSWSNGSTSASITVNATGDYTVTASNNNTCDPATKSVHVTVNPLPDVPAVKAESEACAASSNHAASVTNVASGVTYSWSIDNGSITNGQGTSSITYTAGADATKPTSITVTATDGNGCTNSATVKVANKACVAGCTLTQGAYGSSGGAGNSGSVGAGIGSGLTIGAGNSSLVLTPSDVQCVILRMPAGGTPSVLPAAAGGNKFSAYPTCATTTSALVSKQGKFTNVLLGQALALAFNIANDGNLAGVTLCNTLMTQKAIGTYLDPNSTLTVQIPSNVVANAPTVGDLLTLANNALGGLTLPAGVSLSDVNTAVDAVNRAFDGCRTKINCVPVSSLTATAQMLAAQGIGLCANARTIDGSGQVRMLMIPQSVVDAMAALNLEPNVRSLGVLSDLASNAKSIGGLSIDDLNAAIDAVNQAAADGRIVSCSNN